MVDGLRGTVDLSAIIHSPQAEFFTALADPAAFAQVRVEYSAATWPGDLDLAPDAMHAEIKKNSVWKL